MKQVHGDRYPVTPDGRYFVVRGRLRRRSNPMLNDVTRDRLVKELMTARRAVRHAGMDPDAKARARKHVDDAKVALSERRLVWWEDGAPDFDRHLAKNTPYAGWFAALPMSNETKGSHSLLRRMNRSS